MNGNMVTSFLKKMNEYRIARKEIFISLIYNSNVLSGVTVAILQQNYINI